MGYTRDISNEIVLENRISDLREKKKKLKKKIKNLEYQIEKMKCCGNCKFMGLCQASQYGEEDCVWVMKE